MKAKFTNFFASLLMLGLLLAGVLALWLKVIPALFAHGSSSAFDLGIGCGIIGILMIGGVFVMIGEVCTNFANFFRKEQK